MRYSQKEMLLLRGAAIGLFAVVLSPYVLVKSYPYMKVFGMVVGALALAAIFAVSRRAERNGEIDFIQQPQKTRTVVRQSFVQGLGLLCVSAIMFLSYGVRLVYGPTLPKLMLVPPFFLAAIGLVLFLSAFLKRDRQ